MPWYIISALPVGLGLAKEELCRCFVVGVRFDVKFSACWWR
jgi:hypothetical protein